MPRVNDPYSGHITSDDPRTNLFCAGGCRWPTVPGFHLRAISDNADGAFSSLNAPGIVLYQIENLTNHDQGVWNDIDPQSGFIYFRAIKSTIGDPEEGYKFTIYMIIPGYGLLLTKEVEFPIQRCNQTHLIGNIETANQKLGSTGDTFRLQQEAWNYPEPDPAP